LASTCEQLARQLLESCLSGEVPNDGLVRKMAADDCSGALVRIVAEGLGDRFEPGLCEVYADLFTRVLACIDPDLNAGELLLRYRRIRQPRRFSGDPAAVMVLSRITLGADIAVTSVILDGVKRRFPRADIYFAGPHKNWELFAADPRIRHLPLSYRRGSLRERLSSWRQMESLVRGLVIDPDSRLTQLGLLPVCPEENYLFFESRSYGTNTNKALPELSAEWMGETFGIDDSQPYLAPHEQGTPAEVAVSFGVGDNLLKRIPDPFEENFLEHLSGRQICIDRGVGGEEAERVNRAAARLGIRTWDGSFAGFASIIRRSGLYIGYDSAGQHVAAACGVPQLCVFAGFPCERMFHRWRPTGPGPIEVVRVENADPQIVVAQAVRALERLR
jgi:ADP-heptose:LPS heptosyltransferase